ncbi:ExeM/NucH family extracellular endonuclease [Corynebacteriaceae bacterium 6-324]
MSSTRRLRTFALAALASTSLATTAIPVAHATDEGDNVVISEVYGGGGNNGAPLTNDFIELFNPTDEDIDLAGWSVEYFAASGNTGGSTALTGIIPAGGYFLIQLSAGNNKDLAALPTPDATGSLSMAGANGSVELTDDAASTVDLVGYGTASRVETAGALGLSNSTSASRAEDGADTDDNSADFTAGDPTPTNSAGETVSGGDGGEDGNGNTDPEEPEIPLNPDEAIAIAEIQGTGSATPLNGQTVTTQGEVTAVYSDGGLNGFVIQTPGTGVDVPSASDASHGIFVYMGNRAADEYPTIGEVLTVRGQAGENFDSTQLSNVTFEVAEGEFEPVVALSIDKLPAGDVEREPYEYMLVLPGAHTVTNNYALNTFGEVGLAAGDEAFRQPTDFMAPGADAVAKAEEYKEQLVTLDDARTANYMQSDKHTPLPYITSDNGENIKSLRATDQVEFQNPVIVKKDFNLWRFLPTTPVTGNTASADLPITWEDSRAAELGAMGNVAGDYTISAFNVLNYFTSLGQDEDGCGAYTDINDNPVATNYCTVRGAYSESALADQQEKIVAAINGLNADVIALSEIEDTFAVTGDITRRDEALLTLVDALNADGGNWKAVESPAADEIPGNPDVIRVAFIYNPDRVEPVGASRIFEDERFTGTAREPLAQEFKPVDEEVTETFVAVANHFKSKGSIANDDADMGDGQGNNANLRVSQAEAVLEHLAEQTDWNDKATFVMGDLNTYTREHALDRFRDAGYSVPQEEYNASTSYQFDGMLGSLDHVLANEHVDLQDAQVWNINSDESIAFEYSRRLYNVVDYHDASPFRSSDHDPVKVGFNLDTTDGGDDDGNGNDNGGKDESSTGSSNDGSALGGIFGIIAALAATLGLGALFSGAVDQHLPREIKSLRDQIRAFFGGQL